MASAPVFPVQIFYDGDCSVCAAEIESYLGRNHGGRLCGVNINAPGFTPPPGLTLASLMFQLHVIDDGGTIYRNIEAFQVIWRAFPESRLFRLLADSIDLPLLNPLARCGYRIFARLRRYLPKRRACANGLCPPDSRPPE